MIRNILGRAVDISDAEFDYYNELSNVFGKDVFDNLFMSDDGGRIISVEPSATSPTPMAMIFFLLNLSLNQRLRALDKKLDLLNDIEKRLSLLEKRQNNE